VAEPAPAAPAVTDELYARIGNRIRAIREVYDLTQADLATVAGLNRTSITNIEQGRQNVQVAALDAIARHVGLPISALFGEGDLPELPKVSTTAVCVVDCGHCGRVAEALTSTEAAPASDAMNAFPTTTATAGPTSAADCATAPARPTECRASPWSPATTGLAAVDSATTHLALSIDR